MTAGVIGVTGYAGSELLRILSRHPKITRISAASASAEGRNIEDIYPNFLSALSIKLTNAASVIEESDVVFSALPNGHAGALAKQAVEKSTPFIDLSADFRFGSDEETYKAWYGTPFLDAETHKKSVYGLVEVNRASIAALGKNRETEPVVIGNPGCYPTAISLSLFPALSRGLLSDGQIIADAASGISGGGRELLRAYHFCECADSFSPYKIGSHRHTPEISRNIYFMEKDPPQKQRPVIFTPHLSPMNRGILATVYAPLNKNEKLSLNHKAPRPPAREIEEQTERYRRLYASFYENDPFIRVLPQGALPATGRVRSSNYCDIAVNVSQDGETLILTSAIDNMVKGAAGQAVQNMNVIFGFNEKDGLPDAPAFF
ncbi:MAG: N-acetyl-gamma-glutamyl-phosphate reductase [Spirochaetaceae bacterium]|jgi:N-acetyl-gamma-glutamyl-phosphate reductase|nr:N-acetyl-gamma-glutamyl-phosphate reductase [Spirochaetaceae bacterium]